MLRAIVGLIKGLVVGGGVGFGLWKLGGGDISIFTYAACALVGALVGVVCGRAPWRSETIWTPVVKAIFGGIIGLGLCFVGQRFLPDRNFLTISGEALKFPDGSVLAVAIGALYGMFVEIDDGGKTDANDKASDKPARKRDA